MLRIAFLTVDVMCRNCGVLLSALRSVTRSRDAQGLGLTADAPRYLRTLLRRSLGVLALIPTSRALLAYGDGQASPPLTTLRAALLPPLKGRAVD